MKLMKLHKYNLKSHRLTCMTDVAASQITSQLSVYFFLLFYLFFFFYLNRPLSEVYNRLLNDLIFIPIPRCFPPIRNSSLLNICPNALLKPRPCFSSCPYTLRLTADNLLQLSGGIYPINVANPIQSSHSHEAENVNICTQIL